MLRVSVVKLIFSIFFIEQLALAYISHVTLLERHASPPILLLGDIHVDPDPTVGGGIAGAVLSELSTLSQQNRIAVLLESPYLESHEIRAALKDIYESLSLPLTSVSSFTLMFDLPQKAKDFASNENLSFCNVADHPFWLADVQGILHDFGRGHLVAAPAFLEESGFHQKLEGCIEKLLDGESLSREAREFVQRQRDAMKVGGASLLNAYINIRIIIEIEEQISHNLSELIVVWCGALHTAKLSPVLQSMGYWLSAEQGASLAKYSIGDFLDVLPPKLSLEEAIVPLKLKLD